MYKLKTAYKGVILTKSGRTIILDNVNSNEVELMELERYFTKDKKSKPTDKENKS